MARFFAKAAFVAAKYITKVHDTSCFLVESVYCIVYSILSVCAVV